MTDDPFGYRPALLRLSGEANTSLLYLNLNHPHRRLSDVDCLVGHVGLTEADPAALEVDRLGFAVRVVELQCASVENHADVCLLMGVHPRLLAWHKQDIFDPNRLVFQNYLRGSFRGDGSIREERSGEDPERKNGDFGFHRLPPSLPILRICVYLCRAVLVM